MIMPGYAIVIPCEGSILQMCLSVLSDIENRMESLSPMKTEAERLPPHLTLAAVKMHPAEDALKSRLQKISEHNPQFNISPIGWGMWILENSFHIHLRWRMNTALLSICEECQQILNHDANQVLPYYRFPTYVAKTTLLHQALSSHDIGTLGAFLQQNRITTDPPAMRVRALQLVSYEGLKESVIAEFPLSP